MIPLEPCPFCSGRAVMKRDGITGAALGVVCKVCGAVAKWPRYDISDAVSYHQHEDRIRMAWNRRATRRKTE